MKRLLLLLASLCCLLKPSSAQNINTGGPYCGSMDVLKTKMQQDTSIARRMQQMEVQIQKYVAEKQALRRQGNLRISDPVINHSH